MRSTIEIENLADQAYAEHASGAVDGTSWEHGWLEGVEAGLRWALGYGTTGEIKSLLERASQVGK